MSARELHRLATAVITAGGLALAAIAVSAAHQGVWPAAVFIGASAAALLGAVAWSVIHQRRTTRLLR